LVELFKDIILFQFVACRCSQTPKEMAKPALQKGGVFRALKQVLSNGSHPKPHFGLPEVRHIRG
jgi:hypothetical protein